MSTRSANNKRTQTHEVTGMSRKSAASAKPARSAAGSVRVESASSKTRRKQVAKGESLEGLSTEEKKARKRELRAQDDRYYSASNILMKNDPDYLKRRRIWWLLLAVGMGIIVVLWIWLYFIDKSGGMVVSGLQMSFIVLAYAEIIGAFIYDFVRIRPLRNMYRTQVEGMSQKALTALIEKAAAEEDRARAEKEAKKAAKKNK